MKKRILKKWIKKFVVIEKNYIIEEIMLGADVSMLGIPYSALPISGFDGYTYPFSIKEAKKYFMSNRGHWEKIWYKAKY
jgi:hypothetical protein